MFSETVLDLSPPPQAQDPTQNPETPPKRRLLHELFLKVRVNLCVPPCSVSEEPSRTEKLDQMSFLHFECIWLWFSSSDKRWTRKHIRRTFSRDCLGFLQRISGNCVYVFPSYPRTRQHINNFDPKLSGQWRIVVYVCCFFVCSPNYCRTNSLIVFLRPA